MASSTFTPLESMRKKVRRNVAKNQGCRGLSNNVKLPSMTAGVRSLFRWLVLAGGTCASWFACSAAEQDFASVRKRMIERQIVARGITNQRVLKVMGTVPRHELVPANYRN